MINLRLSQVLNALRMNKISEKIKTIQKTRQAPVKVDMARYLGGK